MPVRIYEIAKKLGIESKAVLARAKDLGILAAKVPSSTLDKITAEYLEQDIAATLPPKPIPAPTPVPEPVPVPVEPSPPPPASPPAVPSEIPGVVPTPPAEVAHPPVVSETFPVAHPMETQGNHAVEAEPDKQPTPEPALHISIAAEAPQAEPVPEPIAAPVTPDVSKPEIESLPTHHLEVSPVVAVQPVEPSVTAAVPKIEEAAGSVSQPEIAPPSAPVPVAPVATPSQPEPIAATPPPAPTPPPVPLPPPPPPSIGDKVGFIQLPGRNVTKPGDKVGSVKLPQKPGKPEPARPQQGRPGQFGQGQGQAGRDRPGSGRPGAPGGGRAADGGRRPDRFVLPDNAEIITLKPPIFVRELAERMRIKPFQLIADLIGFGVFATVNQTIDEAVAVKAAAKHGFKLEPEKRKKEDALVTKDTPKRGRTLDLDAEDKLESLKLRPPVVTIMGHVDHGKTTLLDVIRKSNVAAGEAGGITQHIGAYTISFPHPEDRKRIQQITFLDTPGHAAFSAMRARGANVTDIVVLVVAANDGVMPQTLEALSHAKAAGVPIIVAVNKIDHPNANSLKVRQQLQDKELTPDDWGGDTIFVECSALTKKGVDKLLEMILFQADMLELKANPNRKAKGNVVESGKEPGGPVATVLVRKGTLKLGNVVLCGSCFGKVKALISEEGDRLKEAGPSHAVKILGLNEVPLAGDPFMVVDTMDEARESAEKNEAHTKLRGKAEEGPDRKSILEWLNAKAGGAGEKILRVIVKADTQGSVEAIESELKKIESEKVRLDIIHGAVGTVTTNDNALAAASKAIILGFHTRIDSGVNEAAKRDGVVVKLYAIIYELVDEVKEAMAGLLPPILKENVTGVAEVRKIFELSKGGSVAGCVVASGRIVKGKVRIMRRKSLLYEGILQSLRRFQDEVNEVRAGMECGLRVDGFDDFKEGDTIECYMIEKIPQKI